MKIQAITEYNTPNYPTLDAFLFNPNLITESVPLCWQSNKIVWTALISIAIGGTQSCHSFCQQGKTRIEILQEKNKVAKQDPLASSINKDSSFVAPLFQHGDGIGTYGCEVIMPPVFITEQEAKNIILNEFSKAEIKFDSLAKPDEHLFIKSNKRIYKTIKGEFSEKDTIESNELFFDGYNKELNFSFKFISSEAIHKFQDFEESHSSVSQVDFKKTAEKIRNEIIKNGKINAVVFYEPIPYPYRNTEFGKLNYSELENKARELAIDSLKCQVIDFVHWLKTEKILTK